MNKTYCILFCTNELQLFQISLKHLRSPRYKVFQDEYSGTICKALQLEAQSQYSVLKNQFVYLLRT